jgi:uridine kinase
MKIIVLAGKSGTGKTCALKMLFNKLTSEGKENIIEAKKYLPNGKETDKDFECIVSYDGKSVAIYTMGDYCDKVIEAIVKYAYLDVLVLACNTDYKKKITNDINQNGFHLYVIEKGKPDDPDCDRVVAEIIRLIDQP